MELNESLAEAIRRANEERFRLAELVSAYWQQMVLRRGVQTFIPLLEPAMKPAMKRYWVHVPGWVYAGNFYGRNEREARAAAREWLGVVRLPRRTAVWTD